MNGLSARVSSHLASRYTTRKVSFLAVAAAKITNFTVGGKARVYPQGIFCCSLSTGCSATCHLGNGISGVGGLVWMS